MKQLVNKYPKSPHIRLGPVDVMNEPLRTHIDGTTDTDIPERVLSLDGEPKISNFEFLVADEHITHFDIPMHYS